MAAVNPPPVVHYPPDYTGQDTGASSSAEGVPPHSGGQYPALPEPVNPPQPGYPPNPGYPHHTGYPYPGVKTGTSSGTNPRQPTDSRYPPSQPEGRYPNQRYPDQRNPDGRYPNGRYPDQRYPDRLIIQPQLDTHEHRGGRAVSTTNTVGQEVSI